MGGLEEVGANRLVRKGAIGREDQPISSFLTRGH